MPEANGSGSPALSNECGSARAIDGRALSVGFSLPELVRISKVRDSGGVACRQVRPLAIAKLEQIELRLEELLLMRKHVKELINAWDKRLN